MSTSLVQVSDIGACMAAALAAAGLFNEDEALAIVARASAAGLRPARALVASGQVSIEALERASWWHRGVGVVDFDPTNLDPDAMDTLPLHVCQKAKAIVIDVDPDKTFVVAIEDVTDIEAMDAIRQAMAMRPWRAVVADPANVAEALRRYETRTLIGDIKGPSGEPLSFQRLAMDDGDDSQAGRTLTAALKYVIEAGGSDLRVECRPGRTTLRYRLDSVLHEYGRFDVGLGRQLLGRIKVLSKIDSAQFLLPQDGQMQFSVHGRTVDIRVATSPNVWETEDAVLRVLDRPEGIIKLSDLGFDDASAKTIYGLAERPHGLLLVTGPTGSGKTTTLYSLLGRVATPDRAVLTVEDPVEYRLPNVLQVQVNKDAGRTFASTLASFLRLDPDVIMVGEIRDPETLKTALEASLTGHLVLSSIHTNDAASTPLRLVEMGAEPYLVSSALSGVVGQRLLRKLCPRCKMPRPAPAEMVECMPNPAKTVFEPKENGCPHCNRTGYKGRTAVHEVMSVTEEIGRAIVDHELTGAVTRLSLEAGMVPLREAGLAKVAAGVTSLTEVLRVTAS